MLIVEFRVILPMTVEEYQRGQLYSVAEASKNETGGGEGIEVIINEPFDYEGQSSEKVQELKANGQTFFKGQYTHKIYHLASKVPAFIRMLAPKGALEITEKAWNAYPYCRTVISNPDYMKDNFFITIESMHIADRGESENVHGLSKEELAKREIVYIDIADNDKIGSNDYKEEWDPTLYKSDLTGRGPLRAKEWMKSATPVMCAYKLVRIKFKWFGIQTKVEKIIHRQEERLFTNFHRQVFCWTDKWYPLTMKDIRDHEEKTKRDLDEARHKGEVKGMSVKD